jgi:large subunit ribosomal protein L24
MQRTDDWSSEWNSSENPTKQRKYRENAPMHVKDKLISANLSPQLREELGTRSINIRIGDRAKVMRGDDKGSKGIVSKIDREEEKVYINNLDRQRTDGTMREKPFPPSNLQIQALNLEDEERIEEYDVDEFGEIEVEEEELEELEEDEEQNEMMERMQQQGKATDFEENEEADEEESEESEEETEETDDESESEDKASEEEQTDYSEVVEGNIDEVKEEVESGLDPEKVLEAEKDGKDRKTLKSWLENQLEE